MKFQARSSVPMDFFSGDRRAFLKGGVAALAGSLLPLPLKAAVPSDVFVMALEIDDVISLDPAELFEFTGAEIAGNIYDRLLYFDTEQPDKIVGGIARSWDVSDDGLSFRFRLRPGISFQSGNSLAAEDAAYSLQRMIRLGKTPSFILAQFGFTPDNVGERIVAEDSETLVIRTGRVFAPSFLFACLTCACASIIDSKLVQAHEQSGDLGNKWLRTRSAGSGPFGLRVWKPNEIVILDRFENCWRGKSAMQTVFLRHIAEPGVQRLLIERGDIDVARNLGPDQAAGMAGNPGLRPHTVRKDGLYYMGLNQKNEFLRKAEVRQAFRYLVDYDGIANTILRGQAEIHQTIIPAGYLGTLDDRPYSWKLDEAKRLLAAAGLGDGFAVTIDVRNSQPDLDMAQSLQAGFAQAGITLRLIPGDGKQVLTKYRARHHDIYFGRWGSDYRDPHSNAQAFASNPDNSDAAKVKTLAWRNAWEIPELSRLTDEAVGERDPEKRAAIYHEIQRRVLDDSPFVVLFQEVDLAVERRELHGFVMGEGFDTVFYREVTKSS